MTTYRQDLHVRQGATFAHTYTKLDSSGAAVDITGYTARMAVRDEIGGALEAYLSTGSDADGGTITLGGALGTVALAMTAAQTAALAGDVASLSSILLARGKPAERTVRYVYDLELVSIAGVVTRELEGVLTVFREVTT